MNLVTWKWPLTANLCFLCTNEELLTSTYSVKYESSLLTLWFDYLPWDWEFESSLLSWFIAKHETSKLPLEQSEPIDLWFASEAVVGEVQYADDLLK